MRALRFIIVYFLRAFALYTLAELTNKLKIKVCYASVIFIFKKRKRCKVSMKKLPKQPKYPLHLVCALYNFTCLLCCFYLEQKIN